MVTDILVWRCSGKNKYTKTVEKYTAQKSALHKNTVKMRFSVTKCTKCIFKSYYMFIYFIFN